MTENPNVICNDCAYCKQNKELCKKIDELYDNIDIWIAENAKLKELLKECRLAIFDYPPYDLASDKIRLQIKINQALGEE